MDRKNQITEAKLEIANAIANAEKCLQSSRIKDVIAWGSDAAGWIDQIEVAAQRLAGLMRGDARERTGQIVVPGGSS